MSTTSLLNTDGTHAVSWDSVAELAVSGGALSTAAAVASLTEPGRVVAAGTGPDGSNRRKARAYTLHAAMASGTELERVRGAVQSGAYSAAGVRWRHPNDPLVPANTCPLWRILEYRIEIARSPGGQTAAVQLTLEEF